MNTWTSEPQLQTAFTTLANDRRRSARTAPLQDGTHIWLNGNQSLCVEVIDESPAGIGIVIPDSTFSIGPRIEIDYGGERRTAVVAYLDRRDDGQYRLGLEWIKLREV